MSVLVVALASCGQPKTDLPANTQAATAESLKPVALPERVSALSRGELVSAADRAASLYAAGEVPARADPLVGRTVSLKIAFGCGGPAMPESPAVAGLAQWSWGSNGKTIELTMTPGDWAGSALIAGTGDAPDWEAVEGFWISRPWLASEGCPAILQSTREDPIASPQTLGLAAVFEKGGSRIARRNGRAYAFTVRSIGGTPLKVPQQGYRLILEGRITSFPDGRAFRCRAANPDQRPVCVFATKLDRVAFEDADGATLSEWRPG